MNALTAPREWLTAALDLLFPAVCPVCASTLGAGRRDPLCGACWRGIVRIAPPWCDVCGLPFPAFAALPDEVDRALVDDPVPGDAARCHTCSVAAPPFAWARAAGVYGGPLREALHALKFEGNRALARPLADLVCEQLAPHVPREIDALVPVPLSRARERERGFNQARLIAERLARALGARVEPRWLVRTRVTAPQAELTGAERRANVRGAFAAARAVAGRHVVVVDDVLTTGATAAECARALQAEHARIVGVLAVARVV